MLSYEGLTGAYQHLTTRSSLISPLTRWEVRCVGQTQKQDNGIRQRRIALTCQSSKRSMDAVPFVSIPESGRFNVPYTLRDFQSCRITVQHTLQVWLSWDLGVVVGFTLHNWKETGDKVGNKDCLWRMCLKTMLSHKNTQKKWRFKKWMPSRSK